MSGAWATEGLRSIETEDLDALLELNNAHAAELSYLEAAAFQNLLKMTFLAATSGEPGAPHSLLMAFDQSAAYGSANFAWFQRRFERFVYVDRIVIDAAARGQGLAARHYAQLFARAAAAGHTRIVCEVNKEPPNPGSDAFHARLGFVVVGEARLADSGKTVRYLEHRLQST